MISGNSCRPHPPSFFIVSRLQDTQMTVGYSRCLQMTLGKSRQIQANLGDSRQIQANLGKSRRIQATVGKSIYSELLSEKCNFWKIMPPSSTLFFIVSRLQDTLGDCRQLQVTLENSRQLQASPFIVNFCLKSVYFLKNHAALIHPLYHCCQATLGPLDNSRTLLSVSRQFQVTLGNQAMKDTSQNRFPFKKVLLYSELTHV